MVWEAVVHKTGLQNTRVRGAGKKRRSMNKPEVSFVVAEKGCVAKRVLRHCACVHVHTLPFLMSCLIGFSLSPVEIWLKYKGDKGTQLRKIGTEGKGRRREKKGEEGRGQLGKS